MASTMFRIARKVLGVSGGRFGKKKAGKRGLGALRPGIANVPKRQPVRGSDKMNIEAAKKKFPGSRRPSARGGLAGKVGAAVKRSIAKPGGKVRSGGGLGLGVARSVVGGTSPKRKTGAARAGFKPLSRFK